MNCGICGELVPEDGTELRAKLSNSERGLSMSRAEHQGCADANKEHARGRTTTERLLRDFREKYG